MTILKKTLRIFGWRLLKVVPLSSQTLFSLIMTIKLRDTLTRKYLLLRLMLRCLVFPKCLLPYGHTGLLVAMMRIIILVMVFFIIAIKESIKNTTMIFLTQEIGLISMTIR